MAGLPPAGLELGLGTLLGPVEVAGLGGAALAHLPQQVPTALLSRRPDGGAWITLGADPRTVTRDQVRRLREVLLPVPPAGTHAVGLQVAPNTRFPPPYLV